MIEQEHSGLRRTRKQREEEPRRDRFLWIRNILNLVFMLGAVVGVVVYFVGNDRMGLYVILGAMLFKIAECCFRFIK